MFFLVIVETFAIVIELVSVTAIQHIWCAEHVPSKEFFSGSDGFGY